MCKSMKVSEIRQDHPCRFFFFLFKFLFLIITCDQMPSFCDEKETCPSFRFQYVKELLSSFPTCSRHFEQSLSFLACREISFGTPQRGQGLEVNLSLPTGNSALRHAQNKFRLVGLGRGRNEKIFYVMLITF